MFTENDLKQFALKGISEEWIIRQVNHFENGFPHVRLLRPAMLEDGIFAFNDQKKNQLIDYFTDHIQESTVTKFVPASGAASRMFKHLFEFRESFNGTEESKHAYLADTGFNSVSYFIKHLPDSAFFKTLEAILEKNELYYRDLVSSWELERLIAFILEEKGLNYAALPKGLLEFHDYPDGARTSAEEHLVEAATYARNRDGVSRIHFTISPEHQEKFDALFSRVKLRYEKRFKTTIALSYSQQSPSTDTIAVDEKNRPFRLEGGAILFRPGGHGALLRNLQDLEEEIIFIKNIDNIVPDRLKEATFTYKRLIGGYLLFIRDRVFQFLQKAHTTQWPKPALEEMIQFMEESLFTRFPEGYLEQSDATIQADLFDRLNRPIRVCGMVKNEGEPGGGPFWIAGEDGRESLQIVESSQIDADDPGQMKILRSATHFNPVDLVCATRDYQGKKFDLSRYVDQESGFIAIKSSGGKRIKAQELPGLWNGAMADWITVFVEVPIITFNPVKTVNDLLREVHLKKGLEKN